jgi:hypothetical protein
MLNNIRLRSRDCADGSLHVKSNLGRTTVLPRNDTDDFSFGKDDIVVIINKSEDKFTLEFEVLRLSKDTDYLVLSFTRKGTRKIDASTRADIKMEAGEALTIRANNALNPGGTTA